MNRRIEGKEVAVTGRVFRMAKLRHEWCEFLSDPTNLARNVSEGGRFADLFTFVQDIGDAPVGGSYHSEPAGLAVLRVESFDKWWEEIGFKTRNKVRKAQKSGVEFRIVSLDDAFARGVEVIYNEDPVRQGRRFFHYGKKAPEIKEELGSFLDQSILVGAYVGGELLGFMKLFQGKNVLRTIHIIATLAHREKCVMDGLIGKAVELCSEHKAGYLQYGSWTDGGVGVFREKHGFQELKIPRYFIPLTIRGRLMLQLKMHRPMKERLPKSWVGPVLRLRTKWNALTLRSQNSGANS